MRSPAASKKERNDNGQIKIHALAAEVRGSDQVGLAGHDHQKGDLKAETEGEDHAGYKGEIEAELGERFQSLVGVTGKIDEQLG